MGNIKFTGNTVAVTIGSGGAGASSYSANGANGGTTSFGTYLTASGGRGGALNTSVSITDEVGTSFSDAANGKGGEGLDLHVISHGLVSTRAEFDNTVVGKTGIGHGAVVVLW